MDDTDDLPRRQVPPKLDLDPMSISELRDYIGTLEEEIRRAEAEISKKERHRGDIEGLFKS